MEAKVSKEVVLAGRISEQDAIYFLAHFVRTHPLKILLILAHNAVERDRSCLHLSLEGEEQQIKKFLELAEFWGMVQECPAPGLKERETPKPVKMAKNMFYWRM